MKSLHHLLTVVALAPSAVLAQTIDFETVPGGLPADQLAITGQYRASYGVTFSLSDGSAPVLEELRGFDPGYGFSVGVLRDVAAPGYESQLGHYFLRIGSGDAASAPLPDLLVSYDTPVAAASAQIWDIDGQIDATEQWRVDALDATGHVVDSLTSPSGMADDTSSLSGKPWNWSFDHGARADIAGVRIVFIGSKTTDIGLGFDQFSVSSPVPEPGSVALLAGLAGLAYRGRRRHQDGE
jgi:hypothetical protein